MTSFSFCPQSLRPSQPSVRRFIEVSQQRRFGAVPQQKYVKEAREELNRVLQAYVQRVRDPGYVQGMNYVMALLLCFMKEEDAFWTICTVVEDIRPVDFYSRSPVCMLNGFQVRGRSFSCSLWQRIGCLGACARICARACVQPLSFVYLRVCVSRRRSRASSHLFGVLN